MNTLPEFAKIDSPKELKNWLLNLKEEVRNGNIEQTFPREWEIAGRCLLDDVNLNGPWPDIIQMYFRCLKSSKEYCLSVNVYKGSGGSWRLLQSGK